ncbi:hypothetical protein [Anaerospora hongkongensis]|uniref:hypothetical protein n=1 Tax=Anaerospora hongkongensis TaxID=244830 RepID=UPI00289F0088|nr:hypothetical protein [Anaerospora hongkongensis]
MVFLALTSLLNWKLGFQYNPYNPGNMDIIIPSKSSTVSQKFISIGMTETSSSRIFDISDDYCNYVEEYLNKTIPEKIAVLSKFLK